MCGWLIAEDYGVVKKWRPIYVGNITHVDWRDAVGWLAAISPTIEADACGIQELACFVEAYHP